MRRRIMLSLCTVLVLGFGLILWRYEQARPLRNPTQSQRPRDLLNIALAAISAVLSQTTGPLLVQPISRWVERRQVGLLHWVPLSPFLRAFTTFVLMDYTLYLWHVLTHRVPILWRMHIVHHIDRDLSLTTGLRFHAAELITSSLWRVLQVLLIGVTPRRLSH